jgi:transposase-like protein
MRDDFYMCPQCASYARRIRKRFLDRMISVVMPVNRYKCQSCHWHGNVSKHRLTKLNAAR